MRRVFTVATGTSDYNGGGDRVYIWSPADGTVLFARGKHAPQDVREKARPEQGMGYSQTNSESGVPIATLIEEFASAGV